jgi:membrane-bound lytic murein transglycosylase D
LALESAFNGNAVSKAGAVGYWQIMDEVAKEYGLKYVSQFRAAEKKKKSKSFAKNEKKKAKKVITRDDRKNFNKSTYAAARYLQDRCRNLNNDYLLVVASYNCGVGNVWNAMKKTGKANPDFWDIKKYLPAETRIYVMNFIALNVVFNNYEKFTRNTLSFKPMVIKADNFDEKISEEVGEPTSLNNK